MVGLSTGKAPDFLHRVRGEKDVGPMAWSRVDGRQAVVGCVDCLGSMNLYCCPNQSRVGMRMDQSIHTEPFVEVFRG